MPWGVRVRAESPWGARRVEGRTKVLIRLEEEEVKRVVPSADLVFVSELCCA